MTKQSVKAPGPLVSHLDVTTVWGVWLNFVTIFNYLDVKCFFFWVCLIFVTVFNHLEVKLSILEVFFNMA